MVLQNECMTNVSRNGNRFRDIFEFSNPHELFSNTPCREYCVRRLSSVCLSQSYTVHQTVNHSQNFVDPKYGAHTQNIERLWHDVRGGNQRFGRSRKHRIEYLAEFIFKKNFLITVIRYLVSFCRWQIASR